MGNYCGKPAAHHDHAASPKAASNPAIRLLPTVHSGPVMGMASAGAGCVLSGGEDEDVVLWDWVKAKVLCRWKGHSRAVQRVAYGPKNDLYLSASRDASACVWRMGQDTPLQVFKPSGNSITMTGIAVSEEENLVCTGARDYHVRLWDLVTGQQTTFSKVNLNVVTDIKWVHNEPLIVQTSEDLQVRVWDSRSMKVAQTFLGHVNIPLCSDVSEDGNLIITCSHGFDSHGCEARVFDRRKGQQIHDLKGHEESTNGCAFLKGPSSGGDTGLLGCTVSADRTMRLWDVRKEKCVSSETFLECLPDGPLTCVATLPSLSKWTKASKGDPYCNYVCAANFEGVIQMWGVAIDSKQGTPYLDLVAGSHCVTVGDGL